MPSPGVAEIFQRYAVPVIHPKMNSGKEFPSAFI
jgi:hypothetical protein